MRVMRTGIECRSAMVKRYVLKSESVDNITPKQLMVQSAARVIFTELESFEYFIRAMRGYQYS